MATLPAHPRIPYGEANFQRIRLNRWLYVDKTRFLRRLEEERYFEANRERMNYHLYRDDHLPIGSGTVESACKTVAARMKGSRMARSSPPLLVSAAAGY